MSANGILGLWRGTTATLLRYALQIFMLMLCTKTSDYGRNVPGVALYFTGLSQFRYILSTSPYFVSIRTAQSNTHGSTLPKLSSQGNLIAGAVTRVSVGFVLNPFSVLKARYEVRPSCTEVVRHAVRSSLSHTLARRAIYTRIPACSVPCGP